jgi:LPXTG-site transpeptidase (sortase) family protein
MAPADSDRKVRWDRWLMGAGVALILSAFTLLGLAFSGVVGGGTNALSGPTGPEPTNEASLSDVNTSTGFSLDTARLRQLAEARPTPVVTPVSNAPLDRLVIPKIEVDAPVITLGVDDQGIMQSPRKPFDVGWYDFSARPGTGGNAVFSGHVDFASVGAAVFWNLRELVPGDLIEVRLADGTDYQYLVVSNVSYPRDDAPIADIVGPTGKDTVTIITCTGTFNRDIHQYSHRLVVRAERI